MTAVCPLCDCEDESAVYLKNGSWTLEPLRNFLRGVEVTDADRMVCASWDVDRLDLIVHTAEQADNGPIHTKAQAGRGVSR